MQIIYNTCMCPLSYFIPTSQIADMEITAILDTVAVTRDIEEQRDIISVIWDQNCGGNTIEISPTDLSFLSYKSIGGVFLDRIELSPTTDADVGVYPVTVTVSNPVGYSLPVPGNIQTV